IGVVSTERRAAPSSVEPPRGAGRAGPARGAVSTERRAAPSSVEPPRGAGRAAPAPGAVSAGLALRRGLFRDCELAYDCSYGPRESLFVTAALADGARRGADGLGMLAEQAAEGFLIWRRVRPRAEPVFRRLRAAL